MATLIQFAFVLILKRNMDSETDKSGGDFTRVRGEVTRLNTMSTNMNKVSILDSNQGIGENTRYQEINKEKMAATNPSKLIKKVISKGNKATLTAKLDIISFCLFAFGYFVFNCHYWMKYYVK